VGNFRHSNNISYLVNAPIIKRLIIIVFPLFLFFSKLFIFAFIINFTDYIIIYKKNYKFSIKLTKFN
jgi:hypothetical protein